MEPIPGRQQMELAAADFDLLADVLAARRGTGAAPLDLILPAGDYRPAPGRPAETLEIHGSDLRLLGREGGVRIFATLSVQDARDVVLERITIERDTNLALIAVSAAVTLRDCELTGGDTTINAHDALLELDRVQVRSTMGSFSIRTGGESLLLVRGSLLEGGGILAMAEEGTIYLERTLVDGRDRTAVQMQKGGEAILRDCLLRGRGSLFSGSGEVLLEGVVLASESAAFPANAELLRYCPDHLMLAGPSMEIDTRQAFDRCPLNEER
jgi:hypothetical protein